MDTADPSRRPSRCLRRAARALLGLALAAAGVVRAQEASDDAAPAGGPSEPRSVPGSLRGAAMGLDALVLMQRLRREQHGVPKMLPLLATQTQHGQLWLGLARERSPLGGTAQVRLQLAWQIPLGR